MSSVPIPFLPTAEEALWRMKENNRSAYRRQAKWTKDVYGAKWTKKFEEAYAEVRAEKAFEYHITISLTRSPFN